MKIRMNIRRADDTKAVSLVLVKQKESSEELASKLMDFHWQMAQIIDRHEKQKLHEHMRAQMQEQMQDMTISEKQVFLLGMIMNEETLGPIWQKTLDDPTSEFED